MSILHDEAQRAIAEAARRVLDARMDKDRLLGLLEQTGAHDRVFWDTAVEQGWTALAIPESHGGLGLGLVELGLVAQACGAATAGAPWLTTTYGAAVALGAEPGLAAHWLPRFAEGAATGVVAFAEAGSMLPAVPAITWRDGALFGEKPAVAGAIGANIAVVWAQGEAGPVLVAAEISDDCRAPMQTFDNSRLYATLRFAGTPARPIAAGATALALARDVLARMAVVTAHEQVGGAEALLFAARDYALTRKAFGQPIGAFQSVKHRIAELYGLVEIARANAIHAAAREGQGDFMVAAADARLSAGEAYETAARDCVQIHGGIGVTWQAGLHLHMRRARSLAIEGGTALEWEDWLVDALIGEAA